ncbi:Cysteine protease atg4 [Linnemannia exigua]|uniref:Cysteine protease n=1 Tax=Linnemannia exigua TaxID=604196 RepID=A0AAD4DEJ3_9FUNG|nr:Cysteine protease atg4 [Linnemannia exigua]
MASLEMQQDEQQQPAAAPLPVPSSSSSANSLPNSLWTNAQEGHQDSSSSSSSVTAHPQTPSSHVKEESTLSHNPDSQDLRNNRRQKTDLSDSIAATTTTAESPAIASGINNVPTTTATAETQAGDTTELGTEQGAAGPEQGVPASRLGSRFSVNLSGVGLPSMASNLGLTQANGERAADMAQDLKKNVVNMWHAWFPTPPPNTSSSLTATPTTTSTLDSAKGLLHSSNSGSQSLSIHNQQQHGRPAKNQRLTNSYTLGSKAGSESFMSLGGNRSPPLSQQQPLSPPRGYSLDIPDRKSASASPVPSLGKGGKDASTRIVHEADDPIASRSSTCVPPPSNLSNEPIYLMGKHYPPSPTQWTDFQRDFTSGLIWCTYRHSYPPIKPSTFTTDVGWGCMLRSGQGLLANALAIQFMGRGWNRPAPGDPMWDIYVRILSWFLDDMNARSPFSVHRIALLGKQLGKNIGEWFGPSTTSQVTKALVHNYPESGLGVYVTTDGVIYKDQVEEAATLKKSGGFGHLLILVTIRLGIDKLNPIYNDAIKSTFEFPQTLGIAGGRPSSSYYFVGYQGDDLFYLDPHHSRCVVESKNLNDYTAEDFSTYHCETIRKIGISAIDPSMLLAFYCRDRADFDAFCLRVQELNARPGMGSSIFTIGEKAPDYDDDDDGRLLSVADEEDDDLELIL